VDNYTLTTKSAISRALVSVMLLRESSSLDLIKLAMDMQKTSFFCLGL
jgi:hypothetical protein